MKDHYDIYVCLECGTQGSPPDRDGRTYCGAGAVAHPSGDIQPGLARIAVRVADEGTASHLWRARRRTVDAYDRRERERRPDTVAAS